MIPHIVITGYYGFGNLGDDLLCICTLRIARQLFPSAKVSVFTWSKDPDYLHRLLSEPIDVFNQTIPRADLILHGGGGVFFDFKDGRLRELLINSVIKAIGVYKYHEVVAWYKKHLRKRTASPMRIGLGLGVGLYTKASKRFYSDILVMTDFSYLMVRDQESANNLSLLGITNKTVGTDLAFDYDFPGPSRERDHSGEIAFILRDWTYDNEYLTHWLAIAQQLVTTGYKVRVYSFDKGADHEYLSRFSALEQSVWDPRENADLSAFIGSLSRARVVVSSRAHGVIVAAGLGIPSICIEIEPKLRTIAKMLPSSASLVAPRIDSDSVISRIVAMYYDRSEHNGVKEDVSRNRQILAKEILQVGNFVRQSKLRT
jgi:polysaccharide pyruvyl transferase WcaK-like protein